MKQGWEYKKLGDVADVEYGYTDKSTDEGFFRYIRITDINSNGELIEGGKKYIKKTKESENFILFNDDLLMARTGATFAKVLLYKDLEPSVFASYLIRIKFNIPFVNKLYWYFSKSNNYWDQANQLMSGAAQPHFNGAALKQILLPFPKSLQEQQRIVTILDQAFAAIDQAKANAEQNLKNAKELFESYLQGVFEKKGEGWEVKKIGEVIQKTDTVDPTKDANKEFSYLDVSGVNKETKEIENINVLLGKNAPSRAKKLVKKGDVVFATVRPTHSRVAIIPEILNNQVCSTGYFILRSKLFLSNKLIFYFLLTNHFNSQMDKLQKGASYPAVTDNDVKNILFTYPKSIEQQQSIVIQLDALREETKKLEAIYKKKIEDLEELKKSILQKAFAGEL